jgi:tRNA U38,U39,U40 pseudouridine synthase TruA
MRNLKVTAAYRGTRYHGFQRQSNALTVQEVLESKLSHNSQNSHGDVPSLSRHCGKTSLR